MDRVEAYSLLTDEMSKLTRLGVDELNTLIETGVDIERPGVGGILYRIDIKLRRLAARRIALIGRIHDNSSFRHSLLEERLEFDLEQSG